MHKSCNSAAEEKFRRGIHELLEESLEFWMKFSTSFTEIQKYVTTAKDLLIYVSKLQENWKLSI
ncbi:kinase interacting (KIP1-like) family protein, putative [Medicago truncatula]|uniref:Kinase interacting (KIP1-like) family protein, putative n=1 Tax=Medicago truncatula TaxID=3880 RepID=G7ZZ47_MEDTR|nr:kinase interacting (KIP1-like) family protein, putative [Medicago truncatula]